LEIYSYICRHANNLSGKSKILYEFITRHFLACCSDDAHGWETTVTIDINGEVFSASGLAIQEYNWLGVYPYEKWSDRNIPNFKPNEEFTPTSLTMEQGTTTAPSLLTEAELIALMDKNGIGTDATIAQHIQTIQERGYATKMNPGAHFAPTTLGVALVDAYNSMGLELSQPKLRADMEADMLTICKGNRSKDDVVRFNVKRYRDIFAKINKEAAKLDKVLYYPCLPYSIGTSEIF
jgi:DNA topoisomerase-3